MDQVRNVKADVRLRKVYGEKIIVEMIVEEAKIVVGNIWLDVR